MNEELAQELTRMALDLHEQSDAEQTAKWFLEYVQAAIGVSHATVELIHRGGRSLTATGEIGLQFASTLSISLRTSTSTLGTLTLYDESPNRFTEQDASTAQLYADHAAIALARIRTESTLWEAIEARKVIGQAQGILMERFELTGDQAFAVLRRYSQDSNVKLRDLARKLISTRNLGENV
ncbi:ANTAR domain-containing protein [Kribbella sp. NPDC051718]|uniref:ANTAR domain-containing protein n=1 Tax=Kribbella sp. NPDC051718 TaxID=3155168 RepID=UPI003430831C